MSTIKSILLHVDASAQSAARLELARDLAERHGAAVTALFAVTRLEEVPYSYSAGAEAAEEAVGRHLRWRDEVKTSLQHGIAGDGPEVAWFDLVGESAVPGFLAEAVYADLLVVGQQAPGIAEPGGAPAGFAESVIVESGKPVLVIPRAGRVDSVGRRALIAWNGSAQAARAVTAALPLLRRADEVHAVTWARDPVLAPFSRIGIAEFLGRHGIAATLHPRDQSSHVGEALRELARELDADLVVMGCYGRSRARERVLGGATRSALGTMPVPLLMMH